MINIQFCIRQMVALVLLGSCQHIFAIDLDQFLNRLRTTGVELEVHGIDTELGRYVGTFREANFFDYQNFALTSERPEIKTFVNSLHRHDVIWVKGDVPALGRPLLHIVISDAHMVRAHNGGVDDHEHGVVLPDDLRGLSEIIVKVHAVSPDGRMLVADYKQAILPITVPRALTEQVAGLSRGDLLRIKFEIRNEPEAPVHLRLKPEDGSIEVLESMRALHGTEVEYTGDLVLFPKSPQVMFNVFAIQRILPGNQVREYTIVNFENPDLFAEIRNRLQSIWDSSPIEPQNDRNKLIKRGLKLRIAGKFNFVDAGQANPQILIDSVNAITPTRGE